jgi:hypothetical protein
MGQSNGGAHPFFRFFRLRRGLFRPRLARHFLVEKMP